MNKVVVKINGIEYPMVSEKSKEHMVKLAYYVDDKLKSVTESNPILSTSMAAVLTALTITDTLFECGEENDELAKELERLKQEGHRPSQEVNSEIESLKSQLEQYKIHVEEKAKQIEDLNTKLQEKEDEIVKIKEGDKSLEESLNNALLEAGEWKNKAGEAERTTKIAEKLASDFQNKLYDLQLKCTELEHELSMQRHNSNQLPLIQK